MDNKKKRKEIEIILLQFTTWSQIHRRKSIHFDGPPLPPKQTTPILPKEANQLGKTTQHPCACKYTITTHPNITEQNRISSFSVHQLNFSSKQSSSEARYRNSTSENQNTKKSPSCSDQKKASTESLRQRSSSAAARRSPATTAAAAGTLIEFAGETSPQESHGWIRSEGGGSSSGWWSSPRSFGSCALASPSSEHG